MVAIDKMYTPTARRGTESVLTNLYYRPIDEDQRRLTRDMLASERRAARTADMGSACGKLNIRHRGKMTSIKKSRKSVATADLLDDVCSSSHVKCILSKVSDWTFDVFALDTATNGRALYHVILRLFQHHNLIKQFQLDTMKLMKFASLVEDGYHNNPYHNAIHAADVTQAMHCYISQTKIAEHMTPVEILISLLSAITHDLDHPGVNQNYLIATGNHLAALYDNEAVLEKHHWRAGVAALHQTRLLEHLPKALRCKIENEMRSLILATDMTRQQEFFSTLRERIASQSLDMSTYADRHFILQIALKCADISNPCRPWSVCKKWSQRVCDEFFKQGDSERELSLPVSSLCDRFKDTIPKIQTGFIGFVVEPLFTEFEKYLFPCSTLSEQLIYLQQNLLLWKENDQQLKKLAARPRSLELPIGTASEESADIPSPTPSIGEDQDASIGADVCQCSLELDEMLDRRHSVPVLNLLKKTQSLVRRRSFPNGHKLQTHATKKAAKDAQLLDKIVDQLIQLQDSNNNDGTDSILSNSFPDTLKTMFSHNSNLPFQDARMSEPLLLMDRAK